ncbi:thioesterase [Streptomyces sp. F63]|uniref:thioesterase II family protein n=1 Tax=Streptomyces sp. F63 TaxID=2824887 RepID=UPI001B366DC1|nr:alpha/beta fold hydrolase [Streptomyces sp. F63]MBQ0984638.1 thioesterase [Streptomyces sp. F63]
MTTHSPFRCFLPRPRARIRLYCFPHAGGAASVFHSWARLLPETVELIAVQYPGRQDRYHDSMPGSLPELAEEIVRALETPLDRPTAFFGHSMGAMVAFEAARRLQPRFPSPLRALFVSACKAPAERVPRSLPLEEDALRAYLRELGGEGARALEEDEELWQLAHPVLSGDLRVIEKYEYSAGAPLTCPLVAIGGNGDPSVTPADLERWKDYAIGGATVHVVDGGHFYFDDALPRLTGILTGELARLPAR